MKVPVMDTDTKVQEVRTLVLTEGTDWTEQEREFCDAACVERYLLSTKGDPKGAAKCLIKTLQWRREFRVDELRDASQFLSELRIGTLFVAGHNSKGQPILMSRCRKERPEAHMLPLILRCFVFSAECAVRSLRDGQQQWITVLDMSGFTASCQPPIKASAEMMRVLMDHYPERMKRLFIVDAPTVFWLFFKAVSPFIDPSTRDKIQFVYTKKLLASIASGVPLAKDTPEARFAADECLPAYQRKFDEVAYMAMMRDLQMAGLSSADKAEVKKQTAILSELMLDSAHAAAEDESLRQVEAAEHLVPATTAVAVTAG